jgi:hypothetical protein
MNTFYCLCHCTVQNHILQIIQNRVNLPEEPDLCERNVYSANDVMSSNVALSDRCLQLPNQIQIREKIVVSFFCNNLIFSFLTSGSVGVAWIHRRFGWDNEYLLSVKAKLVIQKLRDWLTTAKSTWSMLKTLYWVVANKSNSVRDGNFLRSISSLRFTIPSTIARKPIEPSFVVRRFDQQCV